MRINVIGGCVEPINLLENGNLIMCIMLEIESIPSSAKDSVLDLQRCDC